MADVTRHFWAKYEPGSGRFHLLENHLVDVGSCFKGLLNQPTIRNRLACAGGRDDLDEATVDRLALLAAFHDIGKVNLGFQAQVWPRQAGAPGLPQRAHHIDDLLPVLFGQDPDTHAWFFELMTWLKSALNFWDDQGGNVVTSLFLAALSHHGSPVNLHKVRRTLPGSWQDIEGLSPSQFVSRVDTLARGWFPRAWDPAPDLPATPQFQHHFLGLCTLADWIGSNEQWFSFESEPDPGYANRSRSRAAAALEQIGLDISGQREQFALSDRVFDDLFGFEPNPLQRVAAEQVQLDCGVAIIESSTGSGKTEAALWRAVQMYKVGLIDGIYFALPTRSAASQVHCRVSKFARNLFPENQCPEVVLAVPGYQYDGSVNMGQPPEYSSSFEPGGSNSRVPWAFENPKRYLAAQIAVGTVDQAMLGALSARHAHLRAACLARNLLVIDEVHASDTYMRQIIGDLIRTQLGAGGYALLMSATLGSVARSYWMGLVDDNAALVPSFEQAVRTPFPVVTGVKNDSISVNKVLDPSTHKSIQVISEPFIEDCDAIAQSAIKAAETGARVLVIRNTVVSAIATQKAIARSINPTLEDALFKCHGVPTLHHSRFAPDDRSLLDRELEQQLGKNRRSGNGLIVVGTQTLEQSLDIDADFLISDLCPIDVLLQRLGRLHRHSQHVRPPAFTEPKCMVLSPEGADLSHLLAPGRRSDGLGPYGYVYKDARILELTRRLVAQNPCWQLPGMNRELVESATHPNQIESLVIEMGLDWKQHERELTGGLISEIQIAKSGLVRRDKDFCTENDLVVFPKDHGSPATRVGDPTVEIELWPAACSPFTSKPIKSVSLPARWFGDSSRISNWVAESVKCNAWALAGREFTYGPLGWQIGR